MCQYFTEREQCLLKIHTFVAIIENFLESKRSYRALSLSANGTYNGCMI